MEVCSLNPEFLLSRDVLTRVAYWLFRLHGRRCIGCTHVIIQDVRGVLGNFQLVSRLWRKAWAFSIPLIARDVLMCATPKTCIYKLIKAAPPIPFLLLAEPDDLLDRLRSKAEQ